MLRFTLFGFPVSVHWLFWVTCALIGGGLGATTQREIVAMVLFVLAAFVSVMIHELGHAFFMRRFGARASIMLYAFGGAAVPDRWFGRLQSIAVSLAGPLVQIACGVAVLWVLRRSTGDSFAVNQFLGSFISVSLFWGILNLVPIFPLDGGQVLNSALGPKGAKVTFSVSVILAGLIALGLLLGGSLLGTVMFGMLAFENVQRLRGERPNSMLSPQR
jgi:stage IV sporulation protein FB